MTAVAVVGTGSAGRRHASNFLAAGADEVVLVSRRPSDPVRLGEHTVAVLDALDDALARADAVVIANPTALHLEVLRRAIEADVHVLCEKPVSVSAAGVADLARRARDRGVVVGVCCQMRFHPLMAQLRDLVNGGALGIVIDAETTQGEHLADYHPDEDYRVSYAARAELGGGVLLTQIHQIDFLQWVLGRFARVRAVGGRRSPLEIDVEDTVSYFLESCADVPVRGHLDYLRRPKRLGLTVTGTEGVVTWDYYAGSLEHCAADGSVQRTVLEGFERNDLFTALVDDFLVAVRTGAEPRTTLDDAAHALAVVDALRQSMDERRTIDVCATGAGRG